MVLKTMPFDASKYLDDAESQSELLTEAFESGEPANIAYVLGIIARARGMSQIAQEAGVTREALYKALSETGDPKLSTLMGVTKALGVRITAEPVKRRRKAKRSGARRAA